MAVLYEVDEQVATITLNRPDAMNSLDPETLAEVNDAFRRLNADDEVRVAILTGAGDRAFCTGSDLKKTMPPKESFADSPSASRNGSTRSRAWK
jgi:E-phenylitaconyl-CoA hydratase